jgi:hypothetical protein
MSIATSTPEPGFSRFGRTNRGPVGRWFWEID